MTPLIRKDPIDRLPIIIGWYSLTGDQQVVSIKADQKGRSDDAELHSLSYY